MLFAVLEEESEGEARINGKILSMTFSGASDECIVLYDDITQAEIISPHYESKDKEIITKPVAYVKGSQLEVSLSFEILENIESDDDIKIRGSIPALSSKDDDIEYEIPETTPLRSSSSESNTYTVSNLKSGVNFPNTIEYYDPLKIVWEIYVDGKWKKLSTTEVKIMILNINPQLGDVLLFETIADIGCRNASGLSGEAEIVSEIWNDFKKTGNYSVPQVKNASGDILTYWKNGGDNNGEGQYLSGLLKNNNGVCRTWAELYYYVLKAQGINNINIYEIRSRYTNIDDGYGGSIFTKSVLLQETAEGIQPEEFNYIWGTSMNGCEANSIKASGQGNQTPPCEFSNHFVVVYNNAQLYDPSYGTGPFIHSDESLEQESEWEANSVGGFVVRGKINQILDENVAKVNSSSREVSIKLFK